MPKEILQENFVRESLLSRAVAEQGTLSFTLARGEGQGLDQGDQVGTTGVEEKTNNFVQAEVGLTVWAVNEEGKVGDEESTTKGGRGIRSVPCSILLDFPLLRLKIGGGHVLDAVEDELVGMTKGGKKMIFSTTEAKLYHVEVIRVKTREVGKDEDKNMEAAKMTSITKIQPEDKRSNEKGADDVVGRMAKLGRAIVPGGRQNNAREEDAQTSNNVEAIQPNKEVLGVEEQEVEKGSPTEIPSVKEEEPGLDVDTRVGHKEPVERRGSGAEVRGGGENDYKIY